MKYNEHISVKILPKTWYIFMVEGLAQSLIVRLFKGRGAVKGV